jgi:Tfp pilus assembly protein PilF
MGDRARARDAYRRALAADPGNAAAAESLRALGGD